MALVVKSLAASEGDTEIWVRSLGWEDPLEEETATHCNILAWEIPQAEELGQLQSLGLQISWTQFNNKITTMWLINHSTLASKGIFS